MNKKQTNKLRSARLLMLASQALLLCFVGYWLKQQYDGEREELKKDLAVQLSQAQQQASDAVLSVYLGDFMRKEGQGLPGRPGLKMKIFDSVRRLPLPKGAVLIDTSHRRGRPPITGKMVYYRSDSTTNNILNQSIRVVLKSTTGIPDSLERRLMGMDTAGLTKTFRSRLQKQGWDFKTRWVPDSHPAPGKDLIYLDHLSAGHYSMEVGGFTSYLLRRMTGPFLFTLFLLGLTAAAFWLTYKSLREQVHLAGIRNDFISNMSHELNTPVATVKVALEALSDPGVLLDVATTRDYIAIARLETDRLEQLINTTLQTSLLEEGKVSLLQEPVDLLQLSEEISRIMKRGGEAGVLITVEGQGTGFTVTGDKLQLQGVLVNLLDNAMKYGGSGGAIKIRLEEDEDMVVWLISDQGPGIPQQYLGRVFDKFFRVPAGNEHSVKGYGLGLSYAARVVQQHCGGISVQNNPDDGCTFTIRLPKSVS